MARSTTRIQQLLGDCSQAPYLLIPFLIPCCYWTYNLLKSKPRPPNNTTKSTLFSDEELQQIEGTSATITLPSGRILGYSEYGLQTGRTIFYSHGLPGSRLEAYSFDAIARRLGARIIGVDRPGYGLSSPNPDRIMLDYAKDVESLAVSLKVDSYGVLGISGGGPFALACAAALPPDKLKSVSVVCGLGSPDMSKQGMNWMYWAGLKFGFPYFPGLCRWWIGRDPAAQLHLGDETRLVLIRSQYQKSNPHPKDAQVTEREGFRHFVRSSRQSLAQGTEAFAQDGKLISTDWGFRIGDIRKDLPVQLWYGKLDTNAPVRYGEEIAERLGANAHLRVEDETHSSIHVNWREQILQDLLRNL